MFFEFPLAVLFVIFCLLFILLYIVSRQSIQQLFFVFHSIFRNDFIATSFIALIFLPGTVIHELSHFFMAIFLFLPVHKLSLLPQRRGDGLILGYVVYEKRDIVRGIIVGIAPIIVGLLFFWWLYSIHFFAKDIWQIQALKVYGMFVLSSTMFSSKQDLVDIAYVIPIILVIATIVYIFHINLFFFLSNKSFVEAMRDFMYSVSMYASISLGIHIAIIIFCKSIARLLHIHYI
ncbi:hypothetical protein BH09PAT2_BH09PAT2_10050 [soil metagenome]